MTKAKFLGEVQDAFLGDGHYEVQHKSTYITYIDFLGGAVDIQGRGLSTSLGGFDLEHGTVTNITFFLRGDAFLTVGGTFTAKAVDKALDAGHIDEILDVLFLKGDKVTGSNGDDTNLSGFGGNDTINGLRGDDVLNGGKGIDTLKGGAGHDVFQFDLGFGKDKITDFDADGGPGKQDFIQLLSGTYTVQENAHGDAVIRLSSHDTLTLVGVSAHQIDNSDFFLG